MEAPSWGTPTTHGTLHRHACMSISVYGNDSISYTNISCSVFLYKLLFPDIPSGRASTSDQELVVD